MANITYIDNNKTLYDQDFYLWVQTTIQHLQERNLEQLDIENLIEEIDSMGRSEKKELKTRLVVLIEHLLKLQYWIEEKDDNARGWRNTVVEQRRQITYTLADSPSLKAILNDVFLPCYQDAKKDTINKYQLPSNLFPEEPPFSLAQVLNADFIP
ncbi:DUF29 domain-containing protein [Dolichospermum circinale CS-1225]|uniref:DUF29 domain-containing protein n=1 Tax=Dolichospermum circinale CS-537/01 TaxID=3021739 RepID=A0ABT5A1N9_9CYAN|nr:DUF29 domain-containing protein [Dolichospermum circinale]MDB9458446.1 DUF29 domain-containing protein [Dolichospermum circinale CS-545/17]MDB9467466.1 DUF29 domain-containing protein [Dolichospermum circinale CS-539/09]MDB9471614.1 DUF29 domain-containing protein [Dolichospermum circinale CS-539]MDB9485860.1 DUF29 domain-containing protein [Dolichospermum circinale CS-537/01]MDB9490393.1 DUF29 domain-containing protein [Dolichospermum circinale CS-534/05]